MVTPLLCPKCNIEPVIHRFPEPTNFFVVCIKCRKSISMWYSSKDKAVGRWNRMVAHAF